jgi:predicted Rossmann fold nucleotide-binding protein DprA/Smf involved in DNA uptake
VRQAPSVCWQAASTWSRPTFRQRRRPEIIRHTGLHPAQAFMVLLELDLAGRLERHAGGNVSLIFGEIVKW